MKEQPLDSVLVRCSGWLARIGVHVSIIRYFLDSINPDLLKKLNAIPRRNIRRYILETTQRYSLQAPVIDVGCGYRTSKPEFEGVLGRILSDEEYVGVDHSRLFDHPVAIGDGPGVLATVTRLPFRDMTFRSVICSELLEHVRFDQLAVKELYRVLQYNGYCLVTLPGKAIPNHQKLPHQVDYRRYSNEQVINLMQLAGFSITDLTDRWYGNYQTNIFVLARKIQSM